MKTNRSLASRLALVAGVAACGPSPAPQPPVTNRPTGDPAAANATPCPSGDALLATAAGSWGKAAADGISADCVALVVAGETLWFIDGSWDPGASGDGSTVGLWSSLVTPAGEVRWADGADDLPPSAVERGGTGRLQAIDLDGDGSDELVFETMYSHGGYEDGGLMVMRVTAAGVESVTPDGGLTLLSDNSAAVSDPAEEATCQGTYQFVDASGGARRLEITYLGECEKTGTRAWVLDGATLTEVTR